MSSSKSSLCTFIFFRSKVFFFNDAFFILHVLWGFLSSIYDLRLSGSAKHRIPQISYGSTSAILSDKAKYKYFFRTCPSDVHQAAVLAALFRKYLFPEVGTVATNDIYGKQLADMFEKEVTGMADVPVSVVSRQRFDVNARAATVRPTIQKVIIGFKLVSNPSIFFMVDHPLSFIWV